MIFAFLISFLILTGEGVLYQESIREVRVAGILPAMRGRDALDTKDDRVDAGLVCTLTSILQNSYSKIETHSHWGSEALWLRFEDFGSIRTARSMPSKAILSGEF